MESRGWSGDEGARADDLRATVIIPSMIKPPRRQPRKRLSWQIGAAVIMIVVTLSGASVLVSAASGRAGVPTPTQPTFGRAASAPIQTPVTAATPTIHTNAARPTATLPAFSDTAAGELCHDTTMFVANIQEWTVPPGCYATIYSPNTASYPDRPGFGYCNWWVREQHLAHPDITENTSFPTGGKPVAGAVAWFSPGVQGASSAGHWAQVVAVSPDGYWFLLSEMNFAWRGGGWAKVDYRYAHTGPGVVFTYA
jgi:hypothetical protein